jgi:hypothetical protein
MVWMESIAFSRNLPIRLPNDDIPAYSMVEISSTIPTMPASTGASTG